MSKLSMKGQCRCGQCRFEVSAQPLMASACHCRGCQRMTASAYSLTLTVPSKGFAVTAGEPVIGGLHGATGHYFCPYCMSWMFTRPDGFEDFVNVRPTLLDDHSWFWPYIEVNTAEKITWAMTSAVHSFPKEPDFIEYPALIAEYTKHGARAPL
jgi:hypothetical protein